MTPRQEDKLVRLLKRRDEAAFRRMVGLYQHKVYNLCFRMLGNAQEAEDLAQDVFVTVFRSIDSFRGDSQFSTWLYRIATNHAKNRILYLARRKSRQRQPLDEVDEAALGEPIGGGERVSRPDRQAMGHELERLLQHAIAQLDEEHRTLIVLREIENLSYQEIGEITGLAAGTVKSRLHRARLQLKEIVDRYQAGERVASPVAAATTPSRLEPLGAPGDGGGGSSAGSASDHGGSSGGAGELLRVATPALALAGRSSP